jgi:hypothetical protein
MSARSSGDFGLSAWELVCHTSLTGNLQVSQIPQPPTSVVRECPQSTGSDSAIGHATGTPRSVSIWMQTTGASLLAWLLCSVGSVQAIACDGRSALGCCTSLLYARPCATLELWPPGLG